MKKSTIAIIAIFLSAIGIIFNSCQKENSPDPFQQEIKAKVNDWLDKGRSPTQANKNANIELLKENLDFSKMRFEQFDQDDQILLVPVKEEFKKEKNIDKNSIPNLVLIMSKNGDIKSGNIVLYIPENNQAVRNIPDSTFNKIFNAKAPSCEGQFRFLSITGRWLYQLKYKNGQLHSSGSVRSTPPPGSNNATARTNSTCIDWYLVTSYYVNGVLIDQTWEYLGTSCSGCDDPNLQSLCPDDGNGGGGVGDGIDCCISDPNTQLSSNSISETIGDDCGLESIDPVTGRPVKTCIHNWYFSSNSLLWWSWKYKSSEISKLEKEGGVWKFKEVTHGSTSTEGNIPTCAVFNLTASGNPSISADRSVAKMILSYSISFSISCWQSGTNIVSSIASSTWSAPQG